ncbi:alpha/beta hydrolase [Halomonas marinisediminis]|uniref:Alpha/beta hydrolase n=1 Tax=Halomonas marinisediminis TaxID=2546095 RepID=A0ABY2D8T1_9GAMM|nr:alpha/beta hydrolase [Halomonas marinisediminis]TDB04353.1 alpha/beta hydrolase [Halomonas marinisediminis]
MLYRDFATQETIDAAYDPMRGRDGAALVADWRARSEASRVRHRVSLDVPYGPSLAERLDIYHAEGLRQGERAPLHLFFHGGYWRSLDSHEFGFIVDDLVASGITVGVVNYALCPTVRFGELVRQARAALVWAWRHADELNCDPAEISVSGHSAGGHLSAMLLATDWAGEYGLPESPLRGALCISGLYDLRPFPWSWLQPKLQLDGRDVAEFSPTFLPCRVPTRVSLIAGGEESTEFARQMEAYATHLERQGIGVEHAVLPDDDHFSILEHYLDGGCLAETIKRFHR